MKEENPVEEKTALLLMGVNNIATVDDKKFEELVDAISFKELEDRDRKLAEGFLRTAKEDIKAARILYERGLYATSVYHLEQVVEKEVKAYLIMLGKMNYYDFCSEGKKKGITHMTTKIIVRIFDEAMEKIDKIHKETVGQPLIPKEEKKKFHETFSLLKEMSAGEKFLDFDEYFRNFLEESVMLLENSEKEEDISKIVNDAIKSLEGNENIPDEAMETLKTKKKELILLIPKMVGLFTGLYMLSALTFPHEAFTRYPRCQERDVPQPWEYSPKSFNFIKEESFILDVTEKYLNAMCDLIKKMGDEKWKTV